MAFLWLPWSFKSFSGLWSLFFYKISFADFEKLNSRILAFIKEMIFEINRHLFSVHHPLKCVLCDWYSITGDSGGLADDWAGWLPEPPSLIPFFNHTHHGGDGVEPGERWTWILEWTAEGALVGEKNTTHLNSLRTSQEGLQYFFCSNTLPSFATDTC